MYTLCRARSYVMYICKMVDFDESFSIRSKQITEVLDTVSSIKARNVLIAGDFNTSAKRMRVFLAKYPQF